MEFLTQLVDASKLGGWARAVVASLLGVAIAKWPGLAGYIPPDAQAAIGAAVASIVVGAWSHVSKESTSSVARLAKDTPGVATVILKDQATADAIPGNKVIGPQQVPTLAAIVAERGKP